MLLCYPLYFSPPEPPPRQMVTSLSRLICCLPKALPVLGVLLPDHLIDFMKLYPLKEFEIVFIVDLLWIYSVTWIFAIDRAYFSQSSNISNSNRIIVILVIVIVVILEKAMAPHSSKLNWKIPWMEEPGRLQSMGSRRVGHDSATSVSLFTFMHWRRKWRPTPVFLPRESQERRSRLWGRTESDTTEAT